MRRAALVAAAALAACGPKEAEIVGFSDAGVLELTPHTRAGVCERWKKDRANLREGPWSGDLLTCDPGTLDPGAHARALSQVNLFRFLAGLPEVGSSAELDRKAQACALIMDANHMLSHTPPASWRCWTPEGAEAAGSSNLSTTNALAAMDDFMLDFGNETTLGHRRWILSRGLGDVGIGATPGACCLWIANQRSPAPARFVAWPPGGPVPIDLFRSRVPGFTLDTTGWSVQSDGIDLSGATARVSRAGVELPVVTRTLLPGYGSATALSIIAMGWATQPGSTYRVDVARGDTALVSWEVEVVDCAAP